MPTPLADAKALRGERLQQASRLVHLTDFSIPFALGLSFDFAQDIRKKPFVLSPSKGRLRTNGVEVVRGNRKNGKLPTESPDEPLKWSPDFAGETNLRYCALSSFRPQFSSG